MEYNLKIPYDKRSHFAQPLDALISGSRGETIPQVENKLEFIEQAINVYIVGDIVTKDFLSNNKLKQYIKICIIDEKTQRKKITINFEDFFEEIIEFENPAGLIARESWDIINKAIISNKRVLIRITEGEEDLLALPLILKIPSEDSKIKSFVFYGQPPITDADPPIPQGIVMISVDKRIKNKVKELISLMEQV